MVQSNGNDLFFNGGEGRGENVLNSVANSGSLDVERGARPRRDRVNDLRGGWRRPQLQV